ncbi:CBS domain-containing protein [Halobacteriovorax sp.]|uniref:CBS domain-containing protein n=1 Tax=Halobacteriovorax sp. TaxID=2020862 RepID=UPI0035621CD1
MEENFSKIKILSTFVQNHPESASVVLMKSGPKELSKLMEYMPVEALTETLTLVPVNLLEESLALLPNPIIANILGQLNINLTGTVFHQWKLKNRLESSRIDEISSLLDTDLSVSIKRLLQYPENTLGSIMSPVPFSIRENITTAEALSILKKEKNRYNRYIYIIDESSKLHGVVSFKDLFYSKSNTLVSSIMSSDIFYFNPNESLQLAYKNLSWKKWGTIPVVDKNRSIIGLIKHRSLEEEIMSEEGTDNARSNEISQAGAAIGEVFKIGMSASVSALMIPMKGRKNHE